MTNCPNQRFVLAGYSQGAMVIHMALAQASVDGSSELLSKVRGVILLADPLRNPDDSFHTIGTAAAGSPGVVTDVLKYAAARELSSAIIGDDAHLLVDPYPQSLRNVTYTICTSGDPVCDPTSGDLDKETRNAIHGYDTRTLPVWGRQVAEALGW